MSWDFAAWTPEGDLIDLITVTPQTLSWVEEALVFDVDIRFQPPWAEIDSLITSVLQKYTMSIRDITALQELQTFVRARKPDEQGFIG